MRKLILALIILLISNSTLWGTTYYVSKSGSDDSSGTSWQSAWATLSRVNSTINGGDTVFFGTGIYRGYILPKSGTANDRTCYACSSFVEGIASIWASDSLGPWTQYSGNVYRASFPEQENRFHDRCWTLGQVDGVYDTLLHPVGSIGAISEGDFFYDSGSDQIYAWRIGGGDPDGISDMEASMRPVLHLTNGEDYITLWGFKLRYGQVGVVYWNNTFTPHADYNHIEHCHVTRSAGPSGTNIGAIEGNTGGDYIGGAAQYNIIRACTLGYAVEWDTDNDHAYAFGCYSMWNMVLESCIVIDEGIVPAVGICLKGGGQGNVIRYNTIYRSAKTAITFGCAHNSDSAYGNVIVGDGYSPRYPISTGNCTWGYNPFICNNTIYNTGYAGLLLGGDAPMTSPDSTGIIKYNIVSQVTNPAGGYNGLISLVSGDTYAYDIDRNMYFNHSYAFGINRAERSWPDWQSNGLDPNGVIGTDPGFNNIAAGDASRPNSSDEINVSYGGRTWTRIGAWQPDWAPPAEDTTGPVFSNIQTANLASTSVTIAWFTNEPATSQVEYGTTVAYGSSTTADPSLVISHNQPISNLTPETLYHFRVRSVDAAGNESVSSDFTFTTASPDYTPPVISNVAVASVTSQSATVTWTTDEPASSQVEYGFDAAYGSVTELDANLVTGHSVTVTGLVADTTYHFRVISSDGDGNQATGSDSTFTTVAAGGSDNLALGIPASVSGSYPGYTTGVITDGIVDPHGGTGTTWASDESSTLAHWVEIDFGEEKTVGSVHIYWTSNGGWMTSQQYYIQRLSDSGYIDIALVENDSPDSVTMTGFTPVTTSVIRIYQPANMGSAAYSTVMWLTEIEIYAAGSSEDVIAPAAITDLAALPGSNLGELFLTWTAPGDDGSTGQAWEYDLRWSLDSASLVSNWLGCVSVQDAPLPLPAGYQEYHLLTDLEQGQLYYVAVKALDESGNESEISNIAGDTAQYQIALNTDSTKADLDGPSPYAAVSTSRPRLSVQNIDSDGANVYFFEVATDSEFVGSVTSSPAVSQQEGTITRWQVQNRLSSGTVYFWRARANNYEYSDTWSFTVQPATHAYPNPFRLSEIGEVTFTEIPEGATLLLMTVSGATVRMWTDIQGGEITWDGKNGSGNLVASGTYLWFVEGADISNKLVVIR